MSKVFFYGADKIVNLKNKILVKELVEEVFHREKTSLDKLSYIFCSDVYLLEINKQYLNHDTYTDVITFPYTKKGEAVIGEVYLSVDRIKENAKNFEETYQNELLRVIIHGALHLCGYKDDTKVKKEQMRLKEDFYIKQFNVPREAKS